MWIVALALRRPYTFVVMALLILILTPVVLLRTPTDIFPDINIPVISVVWNYQGLSPKDMADHITSQTERGLTTLVNDIEHIESQSLNGVAVVKIFFRPSANIQTALAQVTAISQTSIRTLPPGTTPPLVIQYSASSVPILQIGMSSKTLPELSSLTVNASILPIIANLAIWRLSAIFLSCGGSMFNTQLLALLVKMAPLQPQRFCGVRHLVIVLL